MSGEGPMHRQKWANDVSEEYEVQSEAVSSTREGDLSIIPEAH